MQLTNALCALILAVAVSSAALPNAQPAAAAIANPRCGARGQPCGKPKREPAPEAVPEARCGARGQPCGKIKREAAPEARCGARGQPCGKVKRAAEAFAEALAEPNAELQDDSLVARHAIELTQDLASIIAETQDNPQEFYASLALPEVSNSEKRDALARCGARGQPCGKAKREAEPEAEARCGARGQPCGKLRRAAEAVADAVAFAEPEARCGARGQPCGKAKRDALALAHAAEIALSAL